MNPNEARKLVGKAWRTNQAHRLEIPFDPIFHAVHADDCRIVRKLVGAGSHVESVATVHFFTVLPYVRSRKTFDLLLELGFVLRPHHLAEVISHGYGASLFSGLRAEPHPELLEWILDQGASPDGMPRTRLPRPEYFTPIVEAINAGRPDLVKRLLNHGANANLPSGPKAWWPIHHAAERFAKGTLNERVRKKRRDPEPSWHSEAVDQLLTHGANINTESATGDTPLFIAVKAGSPYAVDYLLNCGSDLMAVNRHGISAFSWAEDTKTRRLEWLAMLMEKHYKIDTETGEYVKVIPPMAPRKKPAPSVPPAHRVDTGLVYFVGDGLWLRAQARRIAKQFEEVSDVLLDFDYVENVGPHFIDELLRAWPLEHPDIPLVVRYANPTVLNVVRKVMERTDLPQPISVSVATGI